MFKNEKVLIFQALFRVAAKLAGEFANFANSYTHLLAKRHLTSRYNVYLYTFPVARIECLRRNYAAIFLILIYLPSDARILRIG